MFTFFTVCSVQLRPTVKPMGKALEYDVSLMERLYTAETRPGTVKTMLNVGCWFCFIQSLNLTSCVGSVSLPERAGSLPFG